MGKVKWPVAVIDQYCTKTLQIQTGIVDIRNYVSWLSLPNEF